MKAKSACQHLVFGRAGSWPDSACEASGWDGNFEITRQTPVRLVRSNLRANRLREGAGMTEKRKVFDNQADLSVAL